MTALNPLGTKPFWVNVYPDTNVSEAAGFHDKNSSDWWADEGRLYRLKVNPWIPHDGGPCPVGPDTKIKVRYRSGGVSGSHPSRIWKIGNGVMEDWWKHEGCAENNIIAYQIVE